MVSPIDDLDPALQAQFLKIQRQFLNGLPQRMSLVEGAADATACRAELHRLTGAAGAYGFEELGRLARDAMHLVEAQAHSGWPPTNAEVWDAALERLRQAVALAMAGAGKD